MTMNALENRLMRKLSLKRLEARKLANKGRKKLDVEDREFWSHELEQACLDIHEERKARKTKPKDFLDFLCDQLESTLEDQGRPIWNAEDCERHFQDQKAILESTSQQPLPASATRPTLSSVNDQNTTKAAPAAHESRNDTETTYFRRTRAISVPGRVTAQAQQLRLVDVISDPGMFERRDGAEHANDDDDDDNYRPAGGYRSDGASVLARPASILRNRHAKPLIVAKQEQNLGLSRYLTSHDNFSISSAHHDVPPLIASSADDFDRSTSDISFTASSVGMMSNDESSAGGVGNVGARHHCTASPHHPRRRGGRKSALKKNGKQWPTKLEMIPVRTLADGGGSLLTDNESVGTADRSLGIYFMELLHERPGLYISTDNARMPVRRPSTDDTDSDTDMSVASVTVAASAAASGTDVVAPVPVVRAIAADDDRSSRSDSSATEPPPALHHGRWAERSNTTANAVTTSATTTTVVRMPARPQRASSPTNECGLTFPKRGSSPLVRRHHAQRPRGGTNYNNAYARKHQRRWEPYEKIE